MTLQERIEGIQRELSKLNESQVAISISLDNLSVEIEEQLTEAESEGYNRGYDEGEDEGYKKGQADIVGESDEEVEKELNEEESQTVDEPKTGEGANNE